MARTGGLRLRDVPRSVSWGLTVAVTLSTIVTAGWHSGHPAERPRLLSGSAWLPSREVGELTLVNGASAEVVARVAVAMPGDRLDALQDGSTGFAVNRTTGSIRRVDGATHDLTQPTTPIPGARDGLAVYLSGDSLYGLDTRHGVLVRVDPRTLVNRDALPLPTHAQVAVGPAGRLWALDSDTGNLVLARAGNSAIRRDAGSPGAETLAVAGESPVLIDHGGQTVQVLDPRTGEVEHRVQLALQPDARLRVGGATHEPRLSVVSADGLFVTCDLTAFACADAVPLPTRGAELGAPVRTGRTAFVPDHTTGRVWIVDLDTRRVLVTRPVVDPSTSYELLTRDGIVFFNDPESERAGVVRPGGEVVRITKYERGQRNQAPTTTRPAPLDTSAGPPAPSRAEGAAPATGGRTGPGRTGTAGGPPAVKILVSNTLPRIGEEITLRASAESGPEPVSAHWSFGNGKQADGVTTRHRWPAAETYQVTVHATFPDGKKGNVTLPVRVSASSRRSLEVRTTGAGVVTSEPPGISCPPTCETTFASGQPVTLTAKPNGGQILTGWRDACSGTAGTCTLLMDGTKTASANFGVRPAGDFTVGPLPGNWCFLRGGTNGYWDVDMWFQLGWTSTNGSSAPANKVRVTTDVGAWRDWTFATVRPPPTDYLDTFADQDDRYLNRLLRVRVTIDPDDTVFETVETNNTFVLVVDLRDALPVPGTNEEVHCYKE